MNRTGSWQSSLLLGMLVGAMGGCSSGSSDSANQADFTIKAPDLGMREICPPKPPPPGTSTPEESAKRDKANADAREAAYQKELADYNRLKDEAPKAAEAHCAALVDAALSAKAFEDKTPAGEHPMAGRNDAAEMNVLACRAIATNSDAPCAVSQKMSSFCRLRRAYVTQAKDKSDKPAVLAQAVFEVCKVAAPKANCAAIRDSIKSGNPARCPMEPAEGGALCAAYAWKDPARCPPEKRADGASRCPPEARWVASLSKDGLAALAADGSVIDKAFADAANGAANACAAAADDYKKHCLTVATPPIPTMPKHPVDIAGTKETQPDKEGAPHPVAAPTDSPTAPGSLPVAPTPHP